ncbi:hypothetical protein KJ680_14430 [bacterium]|nr:hypothetical protein [Verrucomicrobiota bacterium]MBU1959595.1 hypothetical protein [bacterium]
MARLSDPKKAALWQRRFRRFLNSGLAVARFCAAERVSESSFYYWRKKLGPLRRNRAVGAEDRAAGRGGRRTITDDPRIFRPVTVVPAACGVVVRLPGGVRIEVAASQLDTLRAVVAETVRADHDLTTRQHIASGPPLIHQRGDAQAC